MGITKSLGFTQSDSIYNRSVVKRITDNSIIRSEKRLKEASIRIKAARKENSILSTMELTYLGLELLVYILSATYESNRAHSKSVSIQTRNCSLNNLRIITET